MSEARPQILIACDERVRNDYLPDREIERLEAFADWSWFESEGGGIYAAKDDPVQSAALSERLDEIDALVVCHGSPRLDAAIMDHASRLQFVGELAHAVQPVNGFPSGAGSGHALPPHECPAGQCGWCG